MQKLEKARKKLDYKLSKLNIRVENNKYNNEFKLIYVNKHTKAKIGEFTKNLCLFSISMQNSTGFKKSKKVRKIVKKFQKVLRDKNG